MSISLKNISKSFGENCVIKDFSLDIDEGTAVCFFGASGCGKTTLMNIILGVLRADGGAVEGVNGKSLTAVFQEDRLMPWLSVKKNILFVDKNADVQHLLCEMSIEGISNMFPNELSTGMKRRVALARAFAKNGDIYALDECVKGFDFTLKKQVLSVINKYIEGKTALIITHDIEEAVTLCDKIICLCASPLRIEKIIDITEPKSARNNETAEKYKAMLL